MVGVPLRRVLNQHKLITPARYELNIGNIEQVLKYKADYIIHLAAETDHEYCDINPMQAYYINTIGTANMVELAKKLRIPILYLSAGSIFDGSLGRPYGRLAEPNPINHYNKSKYYGELIAYEYDKTVIVRAGWMFGGGPSLDKKFVNKIMTKVRNGEKEIKVCTDCIGSPTYSVDLAEKIKDLVEGKISRGGKMHCVNGEGASRYDFAKEIVSILNLDVQIIPCSIDDLKEEFPCKRTNYEVLQDDLKNRPWQEALKEYLDAYYRH